MRCSASLGLGSGGKRSLQPHSILASHNQCGLGWVRAIAIAGARGSRPPASAAFLQRLAGGLIDRLTASIAHGCNSTTARPLIPRTDNSDEVGMRSKERRGEYCTMTAGQHIPVRPASQARERPASRDAPLVRRGIGGGAWLLRCRRCRAPLLPQPPCLPLPACARPADCGPGWPASICPPPALLLLQHGRGAAASTISGYYSYHHAQPATGCVTGASASGGPSSTRGSAAAPSGAWLSCCAPPCTPPPGAAAGCGDCGLRLLIILMSKEAWQARPWRPRRTLPSPRPDTALRCGTSSLSSCCSREGDGDGAAGAGAALLGRQQLAAAGSGRLAARWWLPCFH